MRSSIKSIFKRSDSPEESHEKLRKGSRSDVYQNSAATNGTEKEDYNTYNPNHADGTPVSAQQQLNSRSSIDDTNAANKGAFWKRKSTSSSRLSLNSHSNTDIVDAANSARRSRGEWPLPAEPQRMDIVDPEHARRTSIGSQSRYAPPGGNAARVTAATENEGRRNSASIPRKPVSQKIMTDASAITNGREMTSSPSSTPTTQTLSHRKALATDVDPVNTRTAEYISYPHDVPDRQPAMGSARLGETAHIKASDVNSTRAAPHLPPKSPNRQSIDGGFGNKSKLATSEPVLEIVKPDGHLHERYLTNTEDVEVMEKQMAKAVLHEKVITKVHNIITTEITRDIHTHEIRHHVQPVLEKQFLPERHWIQTADGRFVEVKPEEAEVKRKAYAYATRVEESVSVVKIDGEPYQYFGEI